MSEQTSSPDEKPRKEYKRRRRSSHRRSNGINRMVSKGLRYGPLVMLLIMFFLAIIPFLDPISLYSKAAGKLTGTSLGWLVLDKNSQVLGGALLLATGIVGFSALRRRIIFHMPWWDRNCPQCSSIELKRFRRRAFDRLIGLLGVPVRRYTCRECQWQGLRIDENRV